MEGLKSTIRRHWKLGIVRSKDGPKDKEEALFLKKKFKGTCNKCGKIGHKEVDCWSGKGSGAKTKDSDNAAGGDEKRKCHKCKKVGHLKRDCPENKDSKKTEETGMFLGMEQAEKADCWVPVRAKTPIKKKLIKKVDCRVVILKTQPEKVRSYGSKGASCWGDWNDETEDGSCGSMLDLVPSES